MSNSVIWIVRLTSTIVRWVTRKLDVRMTVVTIDPAQGFRAKVKLATAFDAEAASDSTHEMIALWEDDCEVRRRDTRAVARRYAEKVVSGESGARRSVLTGVTAEIIGLSGPTVRPGAA